MVVEGQTNSGRKTLVFVCEWCNRKLMQFDPESGAPISTFHPRFYNSKSKRRENGIPIRVLGGGYHRKYPRAWTYCSMHCMIEHRNMQNRGPNPVAFPLVMSKIMENPPPETITFTELDQFDCGAKPKSRRKILKLRYQHTRL